MIRCDKCGWEYSMDQSGAICAGCWGCGEGFGVVMPDGESDPRSDQQPNKVIGPLYGVPYAEVLEWVRSWPTDKPLPKPKVRRIR